MADKTEPVAQRRRLGGARHEASERVNLVRIGGSGQEAEVSGWTLNVSRGGVRLVVEDPVEEGWIVRIRLGEASPTAVEREGRVVWVRSEADGQIVGIQFLEAPSGPPSEASRNARGR